MKTIKIKIIVFAIGSVILFAAIYGIYQNFVADDWIDMSEPGPPIEELRTAILKHGDIYSYHQLSRYYPSEVLPFAFYMANEYNCGRACYDVYSCILSLYPHDKIVNNENCRIAMSYLQKGSDTGSVSAYCTNTGYYFIGLYALCKLSFCKLYKRKCLVLHYSFFSRYFASL